jgi:hypothetical protein
MKLDLDIPTWYSQDSIYSSKIKSSDIVLETDCLDFSVPNLDVKPAQDIIEETKKAVIPIIVQQTAKWFSNPLTTEQITKRLRFEFSELNFGQENRFLKISWKPYHFQVHKKGFVLIFRAHSFIECSPRIPMSFLDPMTPRATTPTEEEREEVRNIVLQPGAGPLEQIDDIPLSDTLGSFELRDERMRERQRLRQAKLRAAIARLKVEEMRERYLRQYGDEYLEESSDSEEESLSQDSEISEPVHKK